MKPTEPEQSRLDLIREAIKKGTWDDQHPFDMLDDAKYLLKGIDHHFNLVFRGPPRPVGDRLEKAICIIEQLGTTDAGKRMDMSLAEIREHIESTRYAWPEPVKEPDPQEPPDKLPMEKVLLELSHLEIGFLKRMLTSRGLRPVSGVEAYREALEKIREVKYKFWPKEDA